MKILREIIDKVKGPFQKGEKFEKFAPAVNAFDTFAVATRYSRCAYDPSTSS